jgi:hypothetical protein
MKLEAGIITGFSLPSGMFCLIGDRVSLGGFLKANLKFEKFHLLPNHLYVFGIEVRWNHQDHGATSGDGKFKLLSCSRIGGQW